MLTALAYVDRNPLRAGMVGKAEAYLWSSALAHLSSSDEAGLLDFGELRQVRGFGNWREQMDAPMRADANERLGLSTQTGAPIGSEKFVVELGRKFHRDVEFRKRGGQPKKASQDVRLAIDELIQAATSYDVEVLDRIYHDDLEVIMLDTDDNLNTVGKGAFKSLFESKRDAGDPPMNTWASITVLTSTGIERTSCYRARTILVARIWL